MDGIEAPAHLSKDAGNSYSPRLKPPRHLSTLPCLDSRFRQPRARVNKTALRLYSERYPLQRNTRTKVSLQRKANAAFSSEYRLQVRRDKAQTFRGCKSLPARDRSSRQQS